METIQYKELSQEYFERTIETTTHSQWTRSISPSSLNQYATVTFPDAVSREDVPPMRALELVFRRDLRDMNEVNASGKAALHIAAERGLADIVEVLIKRGARINILDPQGNTALHYACRNGHTDVIRQFIRFQAQLSVQNEDGDTPLHLAILSGSSESVTTLHAAVGTASPSANQNGELPVHFASRQGLTDVLGEMLKYPLESPEEEAAVGETNAARKIRLRTILQHEDQKHQTPLFVSADVETYQLIRERMSVLGLVPHDDQLELVLKVRDIHKRTKLHVAAASDNFDSMDFLAEFLVEIARTASYEDEKENAMAGERQQRLLHAVDDEGKSPLHVSACEGAAKAGDWMIKTFFSLGIQSELNEALQSISETLFRLDGSMSSFQIDGVTVAHWDNQKKEVTYSADRAKSAITKLFALLKLADANGNTFLHLAAKNGVTALVESCFTLLKDHLVSRVVNTHVQKLAEPHTFPSDESHKDGPQVHQPYDVTVFAETSPMVGVGKITGGPSFASTQKGQQLEAPSLDEATSFSTHDLNQQSLFYYATDVLSKVKVFLLDAIWDLLAAENKDGWTALHLTATTDAYKVALEIIDTAHVVIQRFNSISSEVTIQNHEDQQLDDIIGQFMETMCVAETAIDDELMESFTVSLRKQSLVIQQHKDRIQAQIQQQEELAQQQALEQQSGKGGKSKGHRPESRAKGDTSSSAKSKHVRRKSQSEEPTGISPKEKSTSPVPAQTKNPVTPIPPPKSRALTSLYQLVTTPNAHLPNTTPLHYAVRCRAEKLVEVLLNYSAEYELEVVVSEVTLPEKMMSRPDSPITQNPPSDSLGVMPSANLLEQQTPPSVRISAFGNQKKLRHTVLTQRDYFGNTPLFIAAIEGHAGIMKRIIDSFFRYEDLMNQLELNEEELAQVSPFKNESVTELPERMSVTLSPGEEEENTNTNNRITTPTTATPTTVVTGGESRQGQLSSPAPLSPGILNKSRPTPTSSPTQFNRQGDSLRKCIENNINNLPAEELHKLYELYDYAMTLVERMKLEAIEAQKREAEETERRRVEEEEKRLQELVLSERKGAPISRFFSYAELKVPSQLDDKMIHTVRREEYLTDAEFESVFNMDKATFRRMPEKRREAKKTQLGLQAQ